jgi:lysophospholipase L1-like esterase
VGRNLLTGVLVVAVFFLLLEGALRLSGRIPTQALRSPDLETLDRIPGLFEPGQQFVDRIRPDLPYPVRINTLGFRGREVAAAKAAGVWRVICVGDSYTFGHHVTDEEAFPAVLDRLLSGMGHAEAINAGANGFTIVDEARFLRSKGMKLAPDAVVLVFSQNDIADLARPQPMIEAMRSHARLKSRPVVGPVLRGLQRTALFNGMQRAAAWMRVRRLRADAGARRGDEAELWDRYREALAGVAATAGTTPVLLVAWPSAEQAAAGIVPPSHAELARAAGEANVAFLDLSDAMAGVIREGGSPYLVPLDGHPSATGHRAAAGAIARRLADLGWLPAPVAAAMSGDGP